MGEGLRRGDWREIAQRDLGKGGERNRAERGGGSFAAGEDRTWPHFAEGDYAKSIRRDLVFEVICMARLNKS